MRLSKLLATYTFAIGLGQLAGAQTPTLELTQGDLIPTLGNVRFIQKNLCSERGVAIAEVTLTNSPSIGAVLANGFPLMAINQDILEPGGRLQGWNDIVINAHDNIAWILDLIDNPGGNSQDTGVWWNAFLLVREGGTVVSPDVGSGTNYRLFQSVKINDNESILLNCDLRDPTISGNSNPALIRLDTDGAGNLVSTNVLIKDRDPIPGLGTTFVDTPNLTTTIAFNNDNTWIAPITDSNVIALDTMILIDGEVILREGDPSPVEGRNYSDFRDVDCDINNNGDWVASVLLEAPSSGPNDRSLLIKNGEVIVRQLETFPAIEPWTLDRFAASPIRIGDTGDVFWYSSTNNADASQDAGYFRNKEMIVAKGVTTVDGATVNGLVTTSNSFYISRSGRFFISEVNLQGNGESLIMLDFGAVIPNAGCAGNPGTIVKGSGDALVGTTLTLDMDGGQAPGAIPQLFFSLAPFSPTSKCGKLTKFGELLINLGGGNKLGKLTRPPYNGAPVTFTLNIPADPSLVDLQVYAQGLFLDLSQPQPSRIVLTNSVLIEVGAP